MAIVKPQWRAQASAPIRNPGLLQAQITRSHTARLQHVSFSSHKHPSSQFLLGRLLPKSRSIPLFWKPLLSISVDFAAATASCTYTHHCAWPRPVMTSTRPSSPDYSASSWKQCPCLVLLSLQQELSKGWIQKGGMGKRNHLLSKKLGKICIVFIFTRTDNFSEISVEIKN